MIKFIVGGYKLFFIKFQRDVAVTIIVLETGVKHTARWQSMNGGGGGGGKIKLNKNTIIYIMSHLKH